MIMGIPFNLLHALTFLSVSVTVKAEGGFQSACLSKYPGYEGDTDISNGSKITVKFDEQGKMLFRFYSFGAEASCVDCGVHIHSGMTCRDPDLVGGHYWDDGAVEDPWTTEGGAVYNTDAKGNGNSKFELDSGIDFEGNLGHAVVVHARDGSRIACGVLSKSKRAAKHCKRIPFVSACLSKYPGYEGDIDISNGSKITVKFDEQGKMLFRFYSFGAEASCVNCGVHIHSGMTCGDPDLVGGHYWDDGAVEDPWTTEGGAVYNTDAKGNGNSKFRLDSGIDFEGNLGHAVVVHARDGTRIACGVLSKSKRAAKQCFV